MINRPRFTPPQVFQLKSTAWANNNRHRSEAKLYRMWKLNLFPKIGIFTWNWIRQKLPTHNKTRKIGMNVNSYPSFEEKEEDINHVFNQYKMAQTIWNKINIYCPTPVMIYVLLIGYSIFGIINHGINLL